LHISIKEVGITGILSLKQNSGKRGIKSYDNGVGSEYFPRRKLLAM
jgi:hypothetical protein